VNVLVDISVWSLALRRSSTGTPSITAVLRDLIAESKVVLIGPIRQELLSGVRDQLQFDRLRDSPAAFPNLPLETVDYERAAECFNTCRRNGVQGSNTDFLMCAVAERHDIAIFMTDVDFTNFQRYLPITLYPLPAA
jgi:predicted nucleic acid-binding protein